MGVHSLLHRVQKGVFDRTRVALPEGRHELADADQYTSAQSVDVLQDGSLAAARVAVQNQDAADGNALQQGVGSLPLNGGQHELSVHCLRMDCSGDASPLGLGWNLPGTDG